MKKLLLLLFVTISLGAFSQNVITQNSIIKRGGTVSDTIKKDTHEYFYLTATPYVKKVAFQFQTTRLTGNYTKAYAVLEKSYDNIKYYPIDSILISSSSVSYKTKLDIKDVNTFYYRINCYGIDSIQKNKVNLIILNEK